MCESTWLLYAKQRMGQLIGGVGDMALGALGAVAAVHGGASLQQLDPYLQLVEGATHVVMEVPIPISVTHVASLPRGTRSHA